MKTNNLYPVFIKLDEVQVLIVGAGNVGLEKVQFILKQSPDAKIKIVSETFHAQIILLAIKNSNIKITERRFLKEDLDGVKILIAATNNNQVNGEIYDLAQERNILTNVVDSPDQCDFYTAAVLSKGNVKIAVSSNGASPTLAKRLRDILEEVIPEEVNYSSLVLGRIRSRLKGDLKTKINTLNQITDVLVRSKNSIEQLRKQSNLYDVNLN
ncbi:MAG: siroheme synthase [Flavobacteriales bacterium]|nr:MAG: siroheme synthase [Flavobacteriales bacterium]